MFFFPKHNIVREVHKGTLSPVLPCVCICNKLENTQVDTALVPWIMGYLTGRLQFLHLHWTTSCNGAGATTCKWKWLKTEMMVDLRSNNSAPYPVTINGTDVENVQNCRYQDVSRDSKVEWSAKRLTTRSHWSLSTFGTRFHRCYQSIVKSSILVAVVCWGLAMKMRDTKTMNKLIGKAGFVVGSHFISLDEMPKLWATIVDNTSHPLHPTTLPQEA